MIILKIHIYLSYLIYLLYFFFNLRGMLEFHRRYEMWTNSTIHVISKTLTFLLYNYLKPVVLREIEFLKIL